MSEILIPKDQVACKLLAKVCLDQDIATFSKLKSEYFSWSIRPKELYLRIKNRFEIDGRLPTLSGLAELEYAFDPNELQDTVEHYCERTIDGYLSSNLPKKLEALTKNFEEGDYKDLEKSLHDCLELLRSSNLNRSLEVRNIVDLTEEILKEAKIAMLTQASLVTTTGYPQLDALMLGGYRGENLYVWTGRPKKGKTTYLIHQSLRAWDQGKKVMFLSGEMQAKELVVKALSELAGTSQSSLVEGTISSIGIDEVSTQISKMAGDLKDYLVKSTVSTTTVQDIEALVIQYKPDILYVDSAHLFKPDSSSYSRWAAHEKVAEAAQRFKDIATNYSIPVVVSTHLNREAGGKKPRRGNTSVPIDESMVAGSDVWSKAATTLFAVDSAERQDQRKLYMLLNRVGRSKNYLMNFIPDNPCMSLEIREELLDDMEQAADSSDSSIQGEVDSWFS